MINQETLKEYLRYEPETGNFYWIKHRRRFKEGRLAGTKRNCGHRQIAILGKQYLSHRLAWLYVYGSWPSQYIDHINGIPDDNRLSNLRECAHFENHQNRVATPNSSSKYMGVSWASHAKKWVSQIKIKGKKKHLGYYESEEQAHKVYCDAKAKIHTFNPVLRS